MTFPGFGLRDTVRWRHGPYDMVAVIVRDTLPGDWWPVSVVVTAQIGGVVAGCEEVWMPEASDADLLNTRAAECAVEAVAMADMSERQIERHIAHGRMT